MPKNVKTAVIFSRALLGFLNENKSYFEFSNAPNKKIIKSEQ